MTRTFVLIALSVLSAAMPACSSPRPQTTTAPPAVDVQTTTAVATDRAERIEAGGVVTASESAVVSSQLTASIAAVHVRAGDTVRAGDPLVTLDAREVSAKTSQARASVAAAEQALKQAVSEQAVTAAEHELAISWQTRIAALHGRNAATTQELDEADARLAAAVARAAGAQAAVDRTSAQLTASRAGADAAATVESFAVIRAPFAGTVTERFVDPGTLATPGAPLLRIDAGGGRRVEVRVDERRAAYVHPRDVVEVILERPDTRTSVQTITGTVTEVARIEADSRAFAVKVTLPPDITSPAGAFARVRFGGESRRAIVVPRDSVTWHGQVTSVFVAHDGTARIRLIQIGDADDTSIDVVAGLDAGEVIVIRPPSTLVDGTRVRVIPSNPVVGARP
jgi:RND family efflux transporter MFP subunit